jgi:hypothetical protein
VVLKPWLRGSVNLTANENIHHEEERTSFFCCSARFRWSMHQPGYVQGGQEVGRDYLLLGIHVRRIRSDIKMQILPIKNLNFEKPSRNISNRTKVKILKKKFF